jgi:hypothetical protein
MAFGVRPPDLGEWIVNLEQHHYRTIGDIMRSLNPFISSQKSTPTRLSWKMLWSNMYSAASPMKQTNPGVFDKAEKTLAPHTFTGEFYKEALQMSRVTREVFCLMEDRHVHPSTLYPGGVGTVPSVQLFSEYLTRLVKYADFMKRVVPLHDDLFDFFYDAMPGYEKVGQRRILLSCWGSWNDPDSCDYTYKNMSSWGRKMFVTPGVVVDGELVTTDLVDINLGIRILLGSSYYDDWNNGEVFVKNDPLETSHRVVLSEHSMAHAAARHLRSPARIQNAKYYRHLGVGIGAPALMNPIVRNIADAVLYEGYMLYPYRRSSVKNRQRWTFGGLYLEAYASDPSSMHAELLAAGKPETSNVEIRFLHLLARGTYQEAMEREISIPGGGEQRFTFPAWLDAERRQEQVDGIATVAWKQLDSGLYKLSIHVANRTAFKGSNQTTRDEASLQALIATHAIVQISGAEFISLTDPPEQYREAVAACVNSGVWPVLVGEEGFRDCMLASPIILYDYPQVAPESPGDLFDGAEIDEILTLRIMTMTDEEKSEMWATDERTRRILKRTESLGPEDLMKLHGVLRNPHGTGAGR